MAEVFYVHSILQLAVLSNQQNIGLEKKTEYWAEKKRDYWAEKKTEHWAEEKKQNIVVQHATEYCGLLRRVVCLNKV